MDACAVHVFGAHHLAHSMESVFGSCAANRPKRARGGSEEACVAVQFGNSNHWYQVVGAVARSFISRPKR